MSALEVQKRLLIVESELNRARLAADLAGLGDGVATITEGATRFEAMFASLVDVTHGLLDLGKAVPSGAGRSSLLSTVIAGGSLLATLWQTFRGQSKS
jgi:hypothetical protein